MKKLLLSMLGLLAGTAYANTEIIIKLKASPFQAQMSRSSLAGDKQVRAQLMQPLSKTDLSSFSKAAGVTLTDVRGVGIGGRVVRANRDLSASELNMALKKLNSDPEIEYAVENAYVKPTVEQPNVYQWDMDTSTSSVPGITATYYGDSFFNDAFVSSNGTGVTVAVLDTGYVPHPNFVSNLISNGADSYGYDFITDCRRRGSCPVSTADSSATVAPSANALDTGDWMSLEEYSTITSSNFRASCSDENGEPVIKKSSWHGTHVTGTIIGQGPEDLNSAYTGVLGGAYGARVVPVRVLGKCGGSTADISDAMLWAGNLHPDIPNPNPAKVLNMSLGGGGGCNALYQDAVNKLMAESVAVVAAAGNSAINVSNANPANCTGVISVAAVGPTQTLTYYSNYGNVTISAAGGDKRIAAESSQVWSTIYTSESSYFSCSGESCFSYTAYQGTSMATPHVTAAVADLLATNSTLTPNNIAEILQVSAKPFTSCTDAVPPPGGDSGTRCVTNGRLDIASALQYANGTIPYLSPNPATVSNFSNNSSTVTFTNNSGGTVNISATTITGANAANFVILNSQNSCITSLPNGGSCSVTVSATNTVAGASYMANLVLANASNQPVASVSLYNQSATPTPATSSSGGGCSMIADGDDASLILVLFGFSVVYLARRRKKQV